MVSKPSSQAQPTAALAAVELLRRIPEMGDYDLRLLRAAVHCLEQNKGSKTPAENFVISLLGAYAHSNLTPGEARKAVDEFELDFQDCIEIAKEFGARYLDKQRDAAKCRCSEKPSPKPRR